MEKEILTSLEMLYATVEDQRTKKGLRHPLVPFLLMVTCAMLCGYYQKREIARFMKRDMKYFVSRFGLKHGVPNHVSVGNILGRIDLDKFMEMVRDWAFNLAQTSVKGDLIGQEWASFDGKCIGSTVSACDNSAQNSVAVISVLSHVTGLVLNQDSYEGKKECEQQVSRRLIEEFAGREIVFMGDALHCQKKQ